MPRFRRLFTTRTLLQVVNGMLQPKTINRHGVKIDTSTGAMPDDLRLQVYNGSYEEPERKLVRRALRPDDRVVEIGCGIGYVSLLATRICGEGSVVSYEANPDMAPIIHRNYALNGWKPRLNMVAVTADGRTLEFFEQEDLLASSSRDVNQTGTKIIVPSVAINDVLAEHAPTVLIMDVEGAEDEILTAADLTNVRMMVIEMHPQIIGQQEVAALIAQIEGKGFRLIDRKWRSYYFER